MEKHDGYHYINSPMIGTSNIIGGGKRSDNDLCVDLFTEMESTNYYSNFTNGSWARD